MESGPMMDDHTDEEENRILKGFPDAALSALVLVFLLAGLVVMSNMQTDREEINRSRFSGGMTRPSFHLECTVPEFGNTTSEEFALQRTLYSGRPYVAVHLFSPSAARGNAADREGGTGVPGEDQTLVQQEDLSLYQFMQLAPGIDPGSFGAGTQRTALLIPSIMNKQMVYEPHITSGYRVSADQSLTKQLLEALWPVYKNPVFPARRPVDISDARTRIYVETRTAAGAEEDEHYLVIGHLSYKFPEALNDGSLAWLAGFSSGMTEIVYLGETWSDPANRTNKRIEFLRSNGYVACANAYTAYAFPQEDDSDVQVMFERLLKAGYCSDDMDRQAYEAAAQVSVSTALLNGSLERYSSILYPPFLEYPDAWAAYIAHCEKENPVPPKWFKRLFLNRLGFFDGQ